MNSSRTGRNIFEILSTQERREHFVASKVRLEQRQRQREEMSYEGTPVKAPSEHQDKDDAAYATAKFTVVGGTMKFLECSGKGRNRKNGELLGQK